MLHLTKLAVGVRDIDQLREWQAERAERNPPLRHRTRSFPRRHHEVIDGGSMYWVINGCMLVRQRIVDIIEDRRDDGTRLRRAGPGPRAGAGRRAADQAVPGLALPATGRRATRSRRRAPSARGEDALPPALRRELKDALPALNAGCARKTLAQLWRADR